MPPPLHYSEYPCRLQLSTSGNRISSFNETASRSCSSSVNSCSSQLVSNAPSTRLFCDRIYSYWYCICPSIQVGLLILDTVTFNCSEIVINLFLSNLRTSPAYSGNSKFLKSICKYFTGAYYTHSDLNLFLPILTAMFLLLTSEFWNSYTQWFNFNYSPPQLLNSFSPLFSRNYC